MYDLNIYTEVYIKDTLDMGENNRTLEQHMVGDMITCGGGVL